MKAAGPVLALALLVTACAPEADALDVAPAATAGAPVFVDSIIPVAEGIRRFREVAGGDVERLAGGEPSLDALVAAFVAAVESADTARLIGMVLTPAEFIDLYYPHTAHTRKPFELDPATLWFQITQNSQKGAVRLLRRYGGRPLDYAGHSCAEEPVMEERNRLWEHCEIRLTEGNAPAHRRLFGTILEREGHFKFVSYANEL